MHTCKQQPVGNIFRKIYNLINTLMVRKVSATCRAVQNVLSKSSVPCRYATACFFLGSPGAWHSTAST